MRARALTFTLCICLAVLVAIHAPVLGQSATDGAVAGVDARLSVFDIPQIMQGQYAALMLVQAGKPDAAVAVLRDLISRFPAVAALHYRMAALLVLEGDEKDALDNLALAVDEGLPAALLERDPAFNSIRDDPRYRELVQAAPPERPAIDAVTEISPAPVTDGVALVSSSDTEWDSRVGMLRILFSFPAECHHKGSVLDDGSRTAVLLNGWFQDGTAAGNCGDLYNNRDRGHSELPPASFPQLSRVAYDGEVKAKGLDRGFNDTFLFNAPTIGNASLAITSGLMWRSLPRAALTNPRQVATLYAQYTANQIYVYPEHRDHDPDNGDLIPANTPYMLISQGSSGSDRPFVQAVAAILAAFRPETKSFLTKNGLIAPTVQWIFRLSQAGVNTEKNYLTGLAHPSVFKGSGLNVLEMVERAHDLEAADVPPMVQLRVVEESHGEVGIDTFLPASDDVLFDTPSAIARVVRSTAYSKRLVVDASHTVDPNGRPLTFQWSVLSGDADRITIHPLNDQGSVAEIVIPWHERHPIIWQPDIATDRVDIGVFANNGSQLSAPAFISVLFPADEKRVYRADNQIAEVDYQDPAFRSRYVDPLLFPLHEWRDVYHYDDQGHLLGWDRVRSDGVSHFTGDGAHVTRTDQLGRPLEAERIRYQLRRRPDGRAEIVEVPTGTIVTYTYASENDQIGTAVSAQ